MLRLGGAKESLSVDMSNTYLDWAGRNFELNQLDPTAHGVERADCLQWLKATTYNDYFDLDSARSTDIFKLEKNGVGAGRAA
jgi:23S rRNA G2069 N7-methylase RlmK/C1962 C5-methylase RlmI